MYFLSQWKTILAAAFVLTAPLLHAQEAPTVSRPVDVAVMYTAEHMQYSFGNNIWLQGGSGELAVALKDHFGIVANVTGEKFSGAIGFSSLSEVAFTSGPRYTHALGHGPARLAQSRLFAEALFGGVHGFNGVFPYSNGASETSNAFAMQAGGGYDIDWKHGIAFRPFDVHFVRTDLPNGSSNRQHDVRVSAGIVWRPVDR
jgi:hypothetical protein